MNFNSKKLFSYYRVGTTSTKTFVFICTALKSLKHYSKIIHWWWSKHQFYLESIWLDSCVKSCLMRQAYFLVFNLGTLKETTCDGSNTVQVIFSVHWGLLSAADPSLTLGRFYSRKKQEILVSCANVILMSRVSCKKKKKVEKNEYALFWLKAAWDIKR